MSITDPRPIPTTNGTKKTIHFSPDGKEFTVRTVQDVEPILDGNKRHANEWGKTTRGKDIVPIASIPAVVQLEWMKRYGIRSVFAPEYADKIKKLLNDPEWRYLRRSELVV